MKGKHIFLALMLSGTVAICLFLALYGYTKTWQLWHIPALTPHFADLRVITAGAESAKQGFDPILKNPADPWQRKLNYPRLWQGLYVLGIDQSWTTGLAIVIITAFLLGSWLFLPKRIEPRTAGLLALAIFSPAVLLGVERANVDLFIFFLLALALRLFRKSPLAASLPIMMAAFLKLYPIFGVAAYLKLNRSAALKFILTCGVVFTSYFLIKHTEMALVYAATPKGMDQSYGMNVFWMQRASGQPFLSRVARVASYLTVLVTVGWAVWSTFFLPRTGKAMDGEGEALDAFRLGGCIYAGTFLLGNNFDYRLLFLIFVIPQLVQWLKCEDRHLRLISKLVLGFLFYSLWQMAISHLPHSFKINFLLDQVAKWGVFCGLLFLLAASAPEWLRLSGKVPRQQPVS